MIPCYAHYSNTNPTWCMYLGEFPSWFLEHLVDFIIISLFNWFFGSFGWVLFCRSILQFDIFFWLNYILDASSMICFSFLHLALLVCFRWLWGSEDSIFVHSSIVHKHWGASPFLSRTLLLDLFDCLSPCGEMFRERYFYLQSLDPQYSLISSNYSSLDMCIWFHSNFEKCTLCGGTLIILTF